jgi:uncharacterized membrane protein YcaP (DUF421 family)
MNEIESWLRLVLGFGLEGKDVNFLQMALRAVVVYIVTVLIVRLGKKRFMGRATAFDVILGIMLGSIVSRDVTGNAPFFGALAASAVLLLMHWLFSAIALHWHGFGWLVKGRSVVLVRDGAVDKKVLRKVHITGRDLWEDLRTKGISDLKQVAEARLERSGKLSVIKAKQEPKFVEVSVAEGVQKVRVEIGG